MARDRRATSDRSIELTIAADDGKVLATADIASANARVRVTMRRRTAAGTAPNRYLYA